MKAAGCQKAGGKNNVWHKPCKIKLRESSEKGQPNLENVFRFGSPYYNIILLVLLPLTYNFRTRVSKKQPYDFRLK